MLVSSVSASGSLRRLLLTFHSLLIISYPSKCLRLSFFLLLLPFMCCFSIHLSGGTCLALRRLITSPPCLAILCNQLVTRSGASHPRSRISLLSSLSKAKSFRNLCSSKFLHGAPLSQYTNGFLIRFNWFLMSVHSFVLIWKFCPYQ
jgi:hypothetical protein